MSLFSSINILERALDGAAFKQKVIASNIANVDTPNYKAKEVAFQAQLAQALDKQPTLKSYRTHTQHLPFTTEIDDPKLLPKVTIRQQTLFNHNGNNVDMDYEQAESAKNQILYSALIDRTNGRFKALKLVLEGR